MRVTFDRCVGYIQTIASQYAAVSMRLITVAHKYEKKCFCI